MNALMILQNRAGVEPNGIFGPGSYAALSRYFNLTDHRHAVHFFAQLAHESAGFTAFSENLNYSKEALQKVFAKYFEDEFVALAYEGNPEKIANRVYANRMGNGDEASGDGWLYRGRGAIQLTGKINYQAFSDFIEQPEIMVTPDVVSTLYAFSSGKYYFDKHNLWAICENGFDHDTIKRLTKAINGGYNGLEERIMYTEKYRQYAL